MKSRRLLLFAFILLQLVLILSLIGIFKDTGGVAGDDDEVFPSVVGSSVSQVNRTGRPEATVVLPQCPSEVPSRGALQFNLTAEVSSWTLDGVAAENSLVNSGGTWQPMNCRSQHRLLVIISYRDREKHLTVLMGHLHPLLQQQLIAYTVIVVEQQGTLAFNKGRLYNAAFREATALQQFDCVVFHDVDLIPENDRIPYTCPEQPTHLSVAVDKFNYTLPYSTLVGGIFILRCEHFIQFNGYPLNYWGWGGEDDDIAQRISYVGLHIARPPAEIARYQSVPHAGIPQNADNIALLLDTKKRMYADGLNRNSYYEVISVKKEPLFTHFVVNVELPAH